MKTCPMCEGHKKWHTLNGVICYTKGCGVDADICFVCNGTGEVSEDFGEFPVEDAA